MERHASNRFSITRQLHYSREETKRSLDLCAFINGLPVVTFELKNSLTKQTVEDAVEQYKRDRDPRETLFEFGPVRGAFAVDDHEVAMCTELKGTKGMAKESVVFALQSGLERRRGQSAQPGRPQNGLPLETNPDPGAVHRDLGELRPNRGSGKP